MSGKREISQPRLPSGSILILSVRSTGTSLSPDANDAQNISAGGKLLGGIHFIVNGEPKSG